MAPRKLPAPDIYRDAVAKANRQRIGRNLKAARIVAGMTQIQVGEAAGYGEMGQGYISRIERGQQNLSIDMLTTLAVVLGTTVHALTA